MLPGKEPMRRTALALAAAAALSACAACGGLGSPDPSRGSVSGRLLGASANAYVYPLGQPERKVDLADDGRWRLDELPAGPAELVIVDETSGVWHAERLPVQVAGADRVEVPAREASSLALAGRVAAVARFGGGCESSALRLTVIGTDQQDVAPAAVGSAALLERLPAGSFRLAGRSGGFVEASADIEVQSGATVAYELALPVSSGEATPGCTADGAGCRSGLYCDRDDGLCYECVEDSHCLAPERCTPNHVCHDPSIVTGETCDPCTQDSQCEAVPGSACATAGFCTHLCPGGDADCPAGFACVPDGGRMLCQAPHGCAEARDEFGGECFYDRGCGDDLHLGVCHGVDLAAEDPVPGYCTGACSRPDDCDLVPGFVCNTTLGLCERTP